jgi:hypothetical protein
MLAQTTPAPTASRGIARSSLNLITNGGLKTDCIGNDSTFSSAFPYLGSPNA